MAHGPQPVALLKANFSVLQAVIQAHGGDFFGRLVAQYHQPTDGQHGPMPTSANPLPLAKGDYIILADVVQALGQDYFDKLIELYGGQQ
jgi:hypothetical protein